jgi:hypothetical protein
MAYVRSSAFERRDPVAINPRRVMPDVLLMPALKLGNPI